VGTPFFAKGAPGPDHATKGSKASVMKRLRIALPIVLLAAFSATALAQDNYTAFTGPVGEEWSRMGTDGTDLYYTTAGSELWKYSFPSGAPTTGTWTQMTSAPRQIDAWDSYRGLAHQAGYLYTSAIPQAGGGRTMIRYQISADSWEVWQSGSTDLIISNTSGNGIFMDPTTAGVGYSVWHAGNHWVQFDWTAQTADNAWLNLGGMLGVPDDHWVSRNEDVAADGNGRYYAVTNDWTGGLSDGDCVYFFDLALGWATNINHVVKKPWQTGAGATLEFIPAGHAANTTGNDELWLYRGGDGLSSSHEGWSTAGTQDLGILDLGTTTWTTYTTSFYQGNGTDSVKIGDHIFIKSCGDDLSPTVYDDLFWVLSGAPGVGYCFGDPGSGTACPCANDNDGSVPGSGCYNGVFSSGAQLLGSGTASVSNDTMVLATTHLEPNNSGLYFQANNDLSPGLIWGDGLQCAGGQLKRLGVRFANSSGYSDTSGWAFTISAKAGNVLAGDTKHYQCWYRTTSNPPCGAGINDFNSSNGYKVVWLP
jgi:hypothetical protein